jgi:hypothetical protein
MQLQLKGSGDGLDIRLQVKWKSLIALIMAFPLVLGAVARAVPEITRLGSLLGLW